MVLEGLFRYALKVADCLLLHDLLRTNEEFMLEYMWALAQKEGRRRAVRALRRDGQEAAIAIT